MPTAIASTMRMMFQRNRLRAERSCACTRLGPSAIDCVCVRKTQVRVG